MKPQFEHKIARTMLSTPETRERRLRLSTERILRAQIALEQAQAEFDRARALVVKFGEWEALCEKFNWVEDCTGDDFRC